MSNASNTDEFVKQLSNCQSRIYAFALSLLGDPDDANDVLQETNLVLWQKVADFAEVKNFAAWAFQVAYFNVQAQRRKKGRDHLLFDDDLLAELADDTWKSQEDSTDRLRMLHECMGKLRDRQRMLLNRRYNQGAAVQVIARELGSTARSVAVMLFRIRASLLQCITSAERGT